MKNKGSFRHKIPIFQVNFPKSLKKRIFRHSFYKTSWKLLERRIAQKNGFRSFKRVLATLISVQTEKHKQINNNAEKVASINGTSLFSSLISQ